jgi:CDP-diacylglycerol--glycerol-3-phosphate 3-phosphatidyltransferase
VPGWTVWVIVIRDIFITLLRSYAEYKSKPVDTSKLAKTKTFVQFVIIYYLLILYVGQNTPYIHERFGELIHILLNYSLVYSMMVIVTAITLWTGIVYIIDNRKIIRELYDFSNKITES